jgi:hypothetical protein
MKEYQIIEGTNVTQLGVRISQLGTTGWKVMTMRCVPLPRPQAESVTGSTSGSNYAAVYVLMEVDVPAGDQQA